MFTYEELKIINNVLGDKYDILNEKLDNMPFEKKNKCQQLADKMNEIAALQYKIVCTLNNIREWNICFIKSMK